MIKHTAVHGSMETVPEVECNFDLVYLRTNVVRLEAVLDDDGREITPAQWQYDEVVMTQGEYAHMVRELLTNDNLNNAEAIALLFENSLDAQEQSLNSMEAVTMLYEQLLALQEQVAALTTTPTTEQEV